jgi:DNA-binding MarR family transcriptional regulator
MQYLHMEKPRSTPLPATGPTDVSEAKAAPDRPRRRREGEGTHRLSDAEMRAWQGLLHAHHEITRTLDAELRAEHALSLDAYDVLLRLARAPERSLRMSQLAERVLVPPSTLTRRVDRLEAEGLIERRRTRDDSRAMIVSLTDQGLARLRRAARTHLRGIREHFTGRLSEQELEGVGAGLEAITGPHQPH